VPSSIWIPWRRHSAPVGTANPGETTETGLPNMRLKLTARGGRLKGKGSVLSAAAAGRTLSAIR